MVEPRSKPVKVSIIIPTLNAAILLENCLQSIRKQTLAPESYEIIVADAHSTDETRTIARKFGAIVLDDDGQSMEDGKRLALSRAQGEFVLFMDADNELSHADYVELGIKSLESNPQCLGLEAYYPQSPQMTPFCAYLTHLRHISDPICWLMSATPILVGSNGDVERWSLPGNSMAYPLGANGFLFRKADLDRVHSEKELFQDTHVALYLMQSGQREWLRLRGRGVHHYYAQNLWTFLKKRRRAIVLYLQVRKRSSTSWGESPNLPSWVAALYCASVVGPICHSIWGWIRDHDSRWWWHVPACLLSLAGVIWGYQTHASQRNYEKLIAMLQPKQNLKL